MFKHIFREFPAFGQLIRESDYAFYLHVVGGLLIGITFIFIGLLCIYPTVKDASRSRKRIVMTKMFGFFLVSCGLSRLLDTVALWHNYAMLTGYIKLLTGLVALLTIFYIPAVIRETIKSKDLDHAVDKIHETNLRLEEVQQISENLDKNKAKK